MTSNFRLQIERRLVDNILQNEGFPEEIGFSLQQKMLHSQEVTCFTFTSAEGRGFAAEMEYCVISARICAGDPKKTRIVASETSIVLIFHRNDSITIETPNAAALRDSMELTKFLVFVSQAMDIAGRLSEKSPGFAIDHRQAAVGWWCNVNTYKLLFM